MDSRVRIGEENPLDNITYGMLPISDFVDPVEISNILKLGGENYRNHAERVLDAMIGLKIIESDKSLRFSVNYKLTLRDCLKFYEERISNLDLINWSKRPEFHMPWQKI